LTSAFGQPPSIWAHQLGVSTEAVELLLASEVIDLHVDTFIWTRLLGYDLRRIHGSGPLGGWFLGQADLPRLVRGGVTGATWVVTTNPLRRAGTRTSALIRNLKRLRGLLSAPGGPARIVCSHADYQRARRDGLHGAFIGIQGANAFDSPSDVAEIPPGLLIRATLVHLSSSPYGTTSSPLGLGSARGLTPLGRELVAALESHRILVDLAHVSTRGFFDAVEAHDPSLPLIVTHTGVSGVYDHWRNLSDAQVRAIADTGGTVGIMYQSSYLGPRLRGPCRWIVDHLAHVVDLVGDDHASLGSDWDGAIVPPRDLPTCLALPRIVQHMLDLGWSDTRIRKILGLNFLRVVEHARG
jgi:membrane dipeptidase